MTAPAADVMADLAAENARLKADLRIAGDRQAASAEILRAIGSVSGNAELPLREIIETTRRLFEASSVSIFVADGDAWGQVLHDGASSRRIGAEVSVSQLRIGGHSLPGAVFSENRQIHLPDINNVDPAIADWPGLPPARAAGTRTISGTPLRRAGQPIGVLIVHRDRLAPFSADELALLQSFADQAAIAIENARLFNETQEALEQQKASADILSVISSSVADTQPVFDKILSSVGHLFGVEERFIFLAGEDGLLHIAAGHGPRIEQARAIFPMPLEGTASEIAFRERRLINSADVFNDPDVPLAARERYRRLGSNYSMVVAPMLWEDRAIGSILVLRTSMVPFSEKECDLLRSFADQAVIAIQNARLFNETREALERQTATADILKVIASSPSDVQPVFEAIAESAKRLAGGHSATVTRVIDDKVHLAAFTAGSEAGNRELQSSFPTPLSSPGIHSRVARSGTIAFRTDIETEPDVTQGVKDLARARGYRSIIVVPMLREGIAIGTIGVTRRDPGPFADNIIDLLRTFADQAVIAIENTRLFNETQEALERQTATADILKVIACSPSDVQPVFEAIAERSNRLVEGLSTAVYSIVGGAMHLMAFTRSTPEADATLQASFPRPLSEAVWADQITKGEIVEITDATVEMPDQPFLQELARLRGFRSFILVPLLRDKTLIGIISVTRAEPGRFADHHVQLLQTFADQAVIAIENVRLFDEVQERTDDLSESLQQQTAVGDVLKTISRSTFDLQPVLDTLVETAARLCETEMAFILRREGDLYRAGAAVGFSRATSNSSSSTRSARTGAPSPAASLLSGIRCKSSTSPPTPNTR